MTYFYIDVSQYDWSRKGSNLDWTKIRAQGIETVFIRATYGDPQSYNPKTDKFVDLAQGAQNAGLKIGGYHNLVHGDLSSIRRQVDYFQSQLDFVNANFAMVDIEPYQALINNGLWPRLSDGELFSQEFSTVDTKRALAVYLPRWVWAGYLNAPDLRPLMDKAKGPLIASNYPLKSQTFPFKDLYIKAGGDSGPGWTSYGNVIPEVWQYSSSSIVDGASNLTDINAYKGTKDNLHRRLVKRRDVVFENFTSNLPILRKGDSDSGFGVDGTGTQYVTRLQKMLQVTVDGEYGSNTANGIKELGIDSRDGSYVDLEVWEKLYAIWNPEKNYETVR